MFSFIFSYKNGCSYSPLLGSPVDAASIIEGMTLNASLCHDIAMLLCSQVVSCHPENTGFTFLSRMHPFARHWPLFSVQNIFCASLQLTSS